MRLLITLDELYSIKSGFALVPLECEFCHKEFKLETKYVKSRIKHKHDIKYCSHRCASGERHKTGSLTANCGQCGTLTIRHMKEAKRSKSGKIFCSQSCAATYNNAHKTTGTRRSKLEVWLEQELAKMHPSLKFMFADKTTINSELDIYIPELKLAFELNGIFHYEPIYGLEKLAQIKNNDDRKFQACLEHGIELVLIDVSKMKHFKEKNAKPYLEIICSIIEFKLSASSRT